MNFKYLIRIYNQNLAHRTCLRLCCTM